MQSDQPRAEEVASDNIIEKEVQPPKIPKRRKKKVSFGVWWALREAEELNKTTENIEQQDSSVEKHAPADQRASDESSGTKDNSLVTEQESISELKETPEKEESSKPSAENVIKQDTSLPAEEGSQENKEEPVISTPEPVTKKEHDEAASLNKESCLTNTVVSPSETKCTCISKSKESEYIEVQKNLMKQLDEMFYLNNKLRAKLKQQKDLTKKLQRKKSMVSVAIQTDSQDTSHFDLVHFDLLHPTYKSASTQTEMTVPIENKNHTNNTVIGKQPQVIEQETASIPQSNGDQQEKKKQSRKSKWRMKRKAAMRAKSEMENISNDQVSGNNTEQKVLVPEIVEDQAASINEIHKIEMIILTHQPISEEIVMSEMQQSGNEKVKKRSKKYKQKKKRKAELRAASELETLNSENLSVENTGEQEVSTPEAVGNDKDTITIEIYKNETVIGKQQQETETDKNSVPNAKSDSEIMPDIPPTIETKLCTPSEDLPGEAPVDSIEEESDITEERRKESAENIMSEPEERPTKKISLWRRIKKALTPTPLRQFKDR